MGKFIKVYPKLTVYCPKSKAEQDGNKCAGCDDFFGIEVQDERFYIDCAHSDGDI